MFGIDLGLDLGWLGDGLVAGLVGGALGGPFTGTVAGAAVSGEALIKKGLKDEEEEIARQKKERDGLLKEAKDKLKADEDAKVQAALGAQSANRARAARAGNSRGGTILTSPLGLVGGPTGVRKTLLGQ